MGSINTFGPHTSTSSDVLHATAHISIAMYSNDNRFLIGAEIFGKLISQIERQYRLSNRR